MSHALGRRPQRTRLLEISVFESNTIGRAFDDGYSCLEFDRGANEETGHPELGLRLDPA